MKSASMKKHLLKCFVRFTLDDCDQFSFEELLSLFI